MLRLCEILSVILCVTVTTGMARAQSRAAGRFESTDTLAAGFRTVPPDARLRMYWRVFGPAWTPAEIDYQFDLLKRAGVGGVMTYLFYPVALDDPARGVHNQRFLSPEFLETFTYAARRARDTGLRFGVSGGTGWPYGGPTVTICESAQRLRRVEVRPETNAKSYVLPALKPGETLVAAFLDGRNMTRNIRADTHLLSIDGQGNRAEHAALSTQHPALDLSLFIAGPTGMQVKRPALGGEGLVVDHYSRSAAQRFLDTAVAPLLKAAPGEVESIFCDSLEVYGSNWTHDLPQEFRKRRGYDLLPELPALFDDDSPLAPDLRFDFWRTLAELTEERFTRTLGVWARKHGVRLEMEAYGTPPNPLTAARFIDLPTGEQYEWQGFSMSRLAASGAHLAGRRLIGAEAWTWTGIPNRLADSLSDLKLASDIHFLAGMNDLTGVDFPYSPRSAGAPGWLPYYGPTMNQNSPQWPYFHALSDYVGRCQWMLRQGTPVADVALYLPVEDAFAYGPTDQMLLDFHLRDHFVSGKRTDEFGLTAAFEHRSDLIRDLLTHGFDYDGIDFWSMNKLAKVQNGRLVCGDGEYSIVILPNLQGIDVDALEKIAAFCRAGGTVIATRRLPTRAYGGAGTDAERRERTGRLRARLREMFNTTDEHAGGNPIDRPYGRGRLVFRPFDDRVTESLKGKADIEIAGLNPPRGAPEPWNPGVTFVHRRDGERDIYFLCNLGTERATFGALFRIEGKPVSRWNPMTGTITPQSAVTTAPGDSVSGTYVTLDLPARGSTFIVFGPAPDARLPHGPPVERAPEPQERSLDLAWHITFDGPNAPQPRDVRELVSWTAWPDARFFSGQATYTTAFSWTGAVPKTVCLRFDQVHEAAEIFVNDRSAGVLWTPPYEADITALLRPGVNVLRVTVGNLPVNRFLGLPDDDLQALRTVYGNRFPAPEEKRLMKEPAPSGLIGPVRMVTEADSR